MEKTSKREKKHPKIKKYQEINIFSQIMHRVIFGEAINRSIERSIEAIGWSSVGRGGDGEEEEEEGASARAIEGQHCVYAQLSLPSHSVRLPVCVSHSRYFSYFSLIVIPHEALALGKDNNERRDRRKETTIEKQQRKFASEKVNAQIHETLNRQQTLKRPLSVPLSLSLTLFPSCLHSPSSHAPFNVE